MPSPDPHVPRTAMITRKWQLAPTIFSLYTRFVDGAETPDIRFRPGQFHMLSLFGVGEVAISISSDPAETRFLRHTIRAVGRVTRAMEALRRHDCIGIRGPFGNGWPTEAAKGRDVVIVTGGLGCAPSVSLIEYILARRRDYGRLFILQGVKHSSDFIFRKHFTRWEKSRDTQVCVAADVAGMHWPFATGFVTDNLQSLSFEPANTTAMLCGPEGMMRTAVVALLQRGVPAQDIWLSMERNMACGTGLCGHCQYGELFICKNGPVFPWPAVAALYEVPGF